MRIYRKKPIVVEAMKWDENTCLKDFHNFIKSEWAHEFTFSQELPIMIPTLEGKMALNFGDYLVKGIRGEFYPCKPDIFEATYSEVIVDEALDTKARKMFEDYSKGANSAPWSQQWEATKINWRKEALLTTPQ